MMKSSLRRCSFGSIHSSGRKASGASPRGTCAAILQGRSDTSNVSTLAAAASPSIRRFQVASTPQASGDTMPRPVTTTRFIELPQPASPAGAFAPIHATRAGHAPAPLL